MKREPYIGTTKLVRIKVLREILLSKKCEGCVVEEISKRSIDYINEIIYKIVNEITEEAMKGNYHKLEQIDIKRGFDLWLRKQIKTIGINILES
jgi:hypothetical protein